MTEEDFLARSFEEHRPHLRAVSYRMLGSVSEADDAVQEAWLRLQRTDAAAVDNLGGWLTTVVARVCLNMLRSRQTRREEPLGAQLPDPVVAAPGAADPEQEALLSDSVGLALLVVLQTLTPAERLAFVLHDMFAVPFDEIAPVVGRSPAATRQLASRARRRVQGAAPPPDPDQARQREVVDAFLAASREGDFDRLVATLDPDIVLRADSGPDAAREVRGAEAVARQSIMFNSTLGKAMDTRPALVNGAAGLVAFRDGRPYSVLGFTVTEGRISELDILLDPARLERLDLTVLD